MARVSGRHFGQELCEIFHLDPMDISGIKLEVNPNEAVLLIIRRFVSEDELQQVKRMLTRYDMIQRAVIDLEEEVTDGA